MTKMPWTKLPFEIKQIIINIYLTDLSPDRDFELYGEAVEEISSATPDNLETRKSRAWNFATYMIDIKSSVIKQYEQVADLPDVSYAFGHDDLLVLLEPLRSKLEQDMASLTSTMNELENAEISKKLDQQGQKREEYYLRARQRRNKTLNDYLFHRKRIVNSALANIHKQSEETRGSIRRACE